MKRKEMRGENFKSLVGWMTGQRKIDINNTINVQKRHMEIQYLEFSICRYTGRDVCEVCMYA